MNIPLTAESQADYNGEDFTNQLVLAATYYTWTENHLG